MNARTKLNLAYFNGALLLAAGIGLVFQSWVVFGIALVLGVIGNVVMGGIRLRKQ